MALLSRRSKRKMPMRKLEALTERAAVAFNSQLHPGERPADDVILGYPQIPDGRGGLATAPLALAAVTNRAFAFADPETGRRHVEYPLEQLTGFANKPSGEFMLKFEAGLDQVLVCAFAPVAASDVPSMLNGLAGNGFVVGVVDAWKAMTGREFVNDWA